MRDLEVALRDHGIRIVAAMPSGLSCTTLLEAASGSGERLVVKMLRHDDPVVDGHDAATFRRKRQQIAALARDLPEAARRHVPIRHEIAGPDWSAHVMPYVDGTDLLSPIDGAAARIGRVVDELARVGYRPGARPRSGPYMRPTHLDRIRRRLPFLDSPRLPARVLDGPGIEVNGRRCRSLAALLAAVEPVADRLEPARLCAPVHGDLNTRNVIADGDRFALIDPRGTLDPVDVCYDLGKILLSVSIWDPFVRDPDGVRVDSHDDVHEVRIPAPAGYAELLAGLPGVFARCVSLTPVLDPGWPMRLAFTHAVHAIAEAACRMSDARAKLRSEAVAVRHATAFLLYGLVLLDDVERRMGATDEFDLGAHLALTDRFSREGMPHALPVPGGRPVSGL
jgi:hypothetical protein